MRKDWEVKKLSDVCRIEYGFPFNSKLFTSDSTFMPLIRIRDLKDFSPETFYTGEYDSNYIVQNGDYLIGMDGEFNIVKWKGNNGLLNQRICRVKSAVEELLNPFLLSYLPIPLKAIEDATPFVTVKHLSATKINNIEVPVPSLQTQHQIVEELDCLTSIIEKQKKQLEELDNLAQSIFYDMFGDPIENEKGWEVKNLDEVCDVRDGTHDSPKYLLYSDYILITSKNIANGKLDFTNANYISKSDFDKINLRSKVDKGDILMAMIGTIGNPIIVNSDNINFCIKNMALIKLTPDSLVHRLYLHSLLSSKSFDELVKRINKGGTQKFIALGTIRKLIIPVPPLPLQEEFASKIEAIEKQKELIKKSIKETEELFNSRMDYYFN